jgi:MFS transporter, DHA1 family, multidrug resistance protein
MTRAEAPSASGVPAPDWRRNLTAVTAAAFIGFTGFTLVMPFLPLFFEELGVRDRGAVAIWSGVSLGVTPAVTAAMAPVWARVAERYGRKLMVGRSLFSFVIIMSAMAFVTEPWHVFGLRAVQGLFAGYGPIAMTMAAESAPPEYMAAAIGWVQTAQRLGPALGPVIGGVLAGTVGLRETFLVSAAFYFGAFLLVVVGYREVGVRRAPGGQPDADADLSFAALRRVRYFVLFMGIIFGLQLVDRSFGPVLPLYLGEIGVADGDVAFLSGVIFTVTAAAAAVGNQTSIFLLRRSTIRSLVSVMAAVAAAGAVLFGLAPPFGVLLGTSVIFGLGMGVATTSVYAAASSGVPASSRGMAFGYLTTAYLLGLAVSPVVAGVIGAFSMRAVFFVDAAGLAAIVWIVRRRMPAGAEAG